MSTAVQLEKATDEFLVDPDELVIDQEKNGRKEKWGKDEIAAQAKSIETRGQLEAAGVVRKEDGSYHVIFGFGRALAVQKLNKEAAEGEPKRKLRVRLFEVGDETDGFVLNLIENLSRKNTNVIDDAHNMKRLREELKWSDARIAKFFDKSLSHIVNLKKLPELDEDVQAEMKAGRMGMDAGLAVATLPKAKQKAVVKGAKKASGKVSTAKVHKAVRKEAAANGTSAGVRSRSSKEIRTFWEEQTGPAESEAKRELAKVSLRWIAGKASDGSMSNALDKWLKS